MPVKSFPRWDESQSAWIAPGERLQIPVPMCKQGRLLSVEFDVISGADINFDIMLEGEDGQKLNRLYGPTRRARGVQTVVEIPFDGDAYVTFDNINWGPLDDMEEVNLNNAAFHKLEEEIEDLDDSCPTKDECQDAMEKIKGSRADGETAIEDYQHNLQTVKSDQVEMLSVSSAAIKDAGSCGFLKTTFQETYAILCTDAVGAVSMMGACCLLLRPATLCGSALL